MARALVTGGTGVLGRVVVARLAERGAEVRVLSRRPGPGRLHGDLVSGEGLAAAVGGVDTIVHCASNGDPRRFGDDVQATRNLLDAAAAAGRPHLVYISIVGIDRLPFGYYRAKLAAEELIERSGLPWTILRTTQFHDLVLQVVATLAKPPVTVLPQGFRFQPVDVRDVADRLADLAPEPAAGRVPDLGGPQVGDLEDFLRAYLGAIGRRRRAVRVPLPGRLAAGFRAGANLVRDGDRGTRPFADFLAERVRPDGTVDLSYGRRSRPR